LLYLALAPIILEEGGDMKPTSRSKVVVLDDIDKIVKRRSGRNSS